MTLEQVWKEREEVIYPDLFGPVSRGIFPLSPTVFPEQCRSKLDPRWLTHGVFEFAPTAQRPSWLYVTSGYSNPWDQEPEDYDREGESGAGVEFTFATSEQGDWAILTLQSLLALDLVLAAGRYGRGDPMSLHDRVPLNRPLDFKPECVLRNVVMTEPDGPASEFALPSGQVLLVGFTAISDAEREYATSHGSEALLEQLRLAAAHPVNTPGRASIF